MTTKFWYALCAGLALMALAFPLPVLAHTWNLQVGAQTAAMAHQAFAFLPDEIWIHATDSITWTFPANEVHTVTFLTPGEVRPSRLVGWGQTNGIRNPVPSEGSALALSSNAYAIFGATPRQEALIRSQIQIMRPSVLPSRVLFVPHWKYVDDTRIFHLRVPAGYTSALFTHLPSRTVFIDADRYINDESLGDWLAHELGHLATNSPKEEDAEKAANKFRKRLRDPGDKNLP